MYYYMKVRLPPSLAKETLASSLSSAAVRGRCRMDDVKDLLTLDRCCVGGGRSQTSTTLEEKQKNRRTHPDGWVRE